MLKRKLNNYNNGGYILYPPIVILRLIYRCMISVIYDIIM
ncbi:hypothetical protein SC08_Contig83orf03602 [Clostridium butyricum]|nr:hypothetical protein SC08_Contig83orf03602 [Clostridium butyricum]